MTLKDFESKYFLSLTKYKQLKYKSNQFSLVRFILFFMSVILLLVSYFQHILSFYYISLIIFILFLFIVYKHKLIMKELVISSSLKDVYLEHIHRIKGDWKAFSNDGNEYNNHYISYDLDLFAKGSLFQLLNMTFTKLGQDEFAESLYNYSTDKDIILDKQLAICELADKEDFVIQLQTIGKLINKKNELGVIQFINKENKCIKNIPVFLFGLPIITCASLIYLLFFDFHSIAFVVLEIGFISSLILTVLFYKQHNEYYLPITSLYKDIECYMQIFQLIQNEIFHSSLLKEIQQMIAYKSEEGILRLSNLSKKITYRNNVIFFVIFNGLGLYDFYLRNQYLQWMKEYHPYMKDWLSGLAQLEVLMSYCTLKIDDFKVSQAVIEDDIILSFHNMKHPLIDQNKSVGNSFSLKSRISLITGSNMSGKTTFMRTIALNLILAYNGGFVLSDDFHCPILKIFTSMRVKDNIEEGISTFYGELLRIKEMIDYSEKQLPMVCFIDEIFKGTNSLDRIAGAKATIDKLDLSHCITFITTHDFELCEFENSHISQYHFEEKYEDDQIIFDYLIKNGQTTSTNGEFLLKQIGIK